MLSDIKYIEGHFDKLSSDNNTEDATSEMVENFDLDKF